jgi:hypothetical protein
MAVLEVWGPGSHDVAVLGGARYCIGKRGDADLSIATDPAVSGMHALLEPAGATWCVRDLGSRNGTFVNGERLFGERVLRDGDEIVVGRTRLVFRDEASGDASTTEALEAPPALTPRERVVLVELCRPLLSANAFTQPASVREIAELLVVSEAAVKHRKDLAPHRPTHPTPDARSAVSGAHARHDDVDLVTTGIWAGFHPALGRIPAQIPT